MYLRMCHRKLFYKVPSFTAAILHFQQHISTNTAYMAPPPSLTKSAALAVAPLPDDHLPLNSVSLQSSEFLANGFHPLITQVPSNITSFTPKSTSAGCFVGFHADNPSSRHVVPIGILTGIKFMTIFRFKATWSTHWVGNRGSEIQHETQLMMLDRNDDGSRPYVVVLPLVEGSFRASLQPSTAHVDVVDMCVESGSTRVTGSTFRSCLYMQAGEDPFTLLKDASKAVKEHLGTFNLMEEKSPPEIVDKFGWCTWDALYLEVNPKGVLEGVKGLAEGGCPPGLVLIDDGWQSICHDEDPITEGGWMNRTAPGERMPCRLIKFEENYKFRDYESSKWGKGMKGFVKELKQRFKSVEFVYVWHALCGYWGGVRPGVVGMPKSKMVVAELSQGVKKTMEDLAVVKIAENGVGLVPPEMASTLYEGMHSHLRSVGIDGVKVDVIQVLDMLGEEYGGRVELSKAYYDALTASVKKHFNGNGIIASMEQCNDFMLLGTEAISLGRVGDDFWCTDPSGNWLQGCHIVHCAYNSLWMGNFIHPDWDMFQSTHLCGEFHAASRAISGGPIYVSDAVGNHNFDLLKRLVLPDGSILRCQHYALPTRDCLFQDPLHDGKTMLKIWNINKYTGVMGMFNCQGGGWCPESQRNKSAPQFCHSISCTASPNDIEWYSGKTPISTKGVTTYAVYMCKAKKLKLLKYSGTCHFSLQPLEFELLTVSPVKHLPRISVQFAPIGLTNMLNSGSAIQLLEMEEDQHLVRVGVKGCGEMKAFASKKPWSCSMDGKEVEFQYDDQKMVTVGVPWPGSGRLTEIEYRF
ncbi:Galactinol--sucrose galactosyltransferase [Linum grandiflorum]